MDEIHIHNLLKRFTEDNLTDEEYLELQAIFQNAESDVTVKRFMDSVWDKLDNPVPLNSVRSELLYQRIIKDRRFASSVDVGGHSVKVMPYWIKIAAGLFLIIAVGLSLNRFLVKKTTLIAYSEYKTAPGKRLRIVLPDGSNVWLNAGSYIRFPQKFTGLSRSVELKGEAFFDVVHDVNKPFVVKTNMVNTQVLGTAFNISAYNKKTIEVTVIRGLVSVNADHRRLGLLSPDRQLEYNLATHSVLEHKVNSALCAAWTRGELVLNNVSMAEAAEMISRWYNVDFIFKDEHLKKCQFVASFPNNADLHQVMAVIGKLNNFKYHIINNRSIYVSGKGCNN